MSLLQVLHVLLQRGISNLVGLSSVNKEFRSALWGQEANYLIRRRLVVHFNGKQVLHMVISNRVRIGYPIATPWLVKIYRKKKYHDTIIYSPRQIQIKNRVFHYSATESWADFVESTQIIWPGHSRLCRWGLTPGQPIELYSGRLYDQFPFQFEKKGYIVDHVMATLGIGRNWKTAEIMVSVRKQGSYFNWLLATFK